MQFIPDFSILVKYSERLSGLGIKVPGLAFVTGTDLMILQISRTYIVVSI